MVPMYVPHQFSESRLPVLHDAIRATRLATLVTMTRDGLVATHLPLLLDADRGPNGTLVGHVARANFQWRDSVTDADALAIFLGPESYISPSWYASKRETGKVVPTWNYIAVHAYGPAEFFDDAGRLRGIVTRLTDAHEAASATPWHVTDAPARYIDLELKAIVGVELPIRRLDGKWKLNQNRSAADRQGVIDALETRDQHTDAGVAGAMRDAMGDLERDRTR
jgi:transcriptional regulator